MKTDAVNVLVEISDAIFKGFCVTAKRIANNAWPIGGLENLEDLEGPRRRLHDPKSPNDFAVEA